MILEGGGFMVIEFHFCEDFENKFIEAELDNIFYDEKDYEYDPLKNINDIIIFCRDILKLGDLDHEVSLCFVSNGESYDGFFVLAEGENTRVLFSQARAIFPALIESVKSVAYIHNHPLQEGEYYPEISDEDIKALRELKNTMERWEIWGKFAGDYIFTDKIYTDIGFCLKEDIDGSDIDEFAYTEY